MTAIRVTNAGGNCFTQSINTLQDMKALVVGCDGLGSGPVLGKFCDVVDELCINANYGKYMMKLSRSSFLSTGKNGGFGSFPEERQPHFIQIGKWKYVDLDLVTPLV